MEEEPPLGIVPTTDRGSLPFALLHGEPLLVWASSALEDADVELLDFDVEWSRVRAAGRTVVVHDPLCPATPADFLAEAVSACLEQERVVVGVRPVTDTLKRLHGEEVGATVDREDLVRVVSPVVLPAEMVSAMPEPPVLADLAALVSQLREQADVVLLEAPPLAARVASTADLAVLEAGFRPYAER